MSSYTERSAELAANAAVAVLAFVNPECTDLEIWPLRPKMYSDAEADELRSRWGGRGLRSIGVLALRGASMQFVLKEPLDAKVMTALSAAFLTYLSEILASSLDAEREGAEIAELFKLWHREDPREE